MNAYYALLFLIIFLSFFRLDQQPIHQWDEARTGVNAVEMLENGDYINLHFGGEPDKIRAKPPLVIWWVAFNFKVFWKKYLEFALAFCDCYDFYFLFSLPDCSTISASVFCYCLLSDYAFRSGGHWFSCGADRRF